MFQKLKIINPFLLLATLFCCTPQKETGTEIRLICWNCDNFQLSLDTLHAASSFLNAQNPDIICLQERPHTNLVSYDSIKKCFPTLPYKVTNGREDENLNVSVFSKYPVSNIKTWYFTDTYNKMIQADIEMDGEMYRLYNVHLQTTSHGKNIVYNCVQRYRQSQLLKSEIMKSPYPYIICGDFNDLPFSYTIINLITKIQELSLWWKGSYQKLGGVFKIDYILMSTGWDKSYYKLIPNNWSDHKIQKSVLIRRNEN